MRTLQFLALILFISFLSCKKDNGSKLPVIKGINKIDINGQPVGTEGVPNVKTTQDGTVFNTQLSAYPNPASSQLNIVIYSQNAHNARVWMVRGRYKGGGFGPNDILGIALNIPIDQAAQLKAGSNVIRLDLADVHKGYYRLYVEFDSYKLWDNIKVDK
jgi:hypothetical protein